MASGTDQDDGYDIFPQSDQILAQSYIYVGWLRKRGTQSFLGAKPWADRLFTTPEGGKTIEYWSPPGKVVPDLAGGRWPKKEQDLLDAGYIKKGVIETIGLEKLDPRTDLQGAIAPISMVTKKRIWELDARSNDERERFMAQFARFDRREGDGATFNVDDGSKELAKKLFMKVGAEKVTKSASGQKLRKGKFHFVNTDTQANFVIVPKNYYSDTMVESIHEALGLSTDEEAFAPNLAFFFAKTRSPGWQPDEDIPGKGEWLPEVRPIGNKFMVTSDIDPDHPDLKDFKKFPDVDGARTDYKALNQMELDEIALFNERIRYILSRVKELCVEIKAFAVLADPYNWSTTARMWCDANSPDQVTIGALSRGFGELEGNMGVEEYRPIAQFLKNIKENSVALKQEVENFVEINISEMERLPASRFFPNDIVPLPTCSHYLIFEGGRRDYELYEKQIKSMLPAGLLLINGEPEAMRVALNNMRSQLPLFIFNNSGGAASVMAETISYVDRITSAGESARSKKWRHAFGEINATDGKLIADFKKRVADRKQAGTAGVPTDPASSKAMKLLNNKFENRIYFPSVSKAKEYKTAAKICLGSWPASYNTGSVLVLDPMSEVDYMQESMMRCMVTAFERDKESGSTEQKERVLIDAWSLHQQLEFNIKKRKWESDVICILIIVVTLTITALTVVYNYLDTTCEDGDDTCDSNKEHLNNINVVMPLILAVLLSVAAQFSPTSKWAALTLARHAIELEIYMFRCKVGEYGNDAASIKDGSPRKVLAERLGQIMEELGSSDVNKGGFLGELVETNKADIARRLKVRLMRSPLYRRYLVRMEKQNDPSKKSSSVFSFGKGSDNKSMVKEMGDLYDASSMDFIGAENSHMVTAPGMEDLGADDDVANLVSPGDDDGIQSLTADKYLQFRLDPILSKYMIQSPQLSWSLRVLQMTMIVVTGITAALVSFGASFWAPVAIAFSTALGSYMNLQGYEVRLGGTNQAISKLKSLVIWWKGLSRNDQSLRVNKTHLVSVTEAIIISTVGSYVAQAQSSRNKAVSGEDDDDKKDGPGETTKA